MRRLAPTGAALLALVLTACGGGATDGKKEPASIPSGTATQADACGGEPVSGGDVTYARQLEVVTLNPLEIKNGNGDIFADAMIYSPLVRNDPEGSADIVPALAESWTISDDGLTYTFTLREGLQYSDGSPITADDIVWNLKRFMDPEVNVLGAFLAEGMTEVEAVDESTVVVHLDHPVSAFLYNIAIFPAYILPKAAVEEQGADFFKKPVSSGPFVVTEFAPGSHISFERNPHYFEEGKPYLDSMRWNFVENTNTRVLSLKSDEAQLADGIPFSQVDALQADSNLALQSVALPQSMLLVTNTKVDELSDVRVRRAMSLAIDREQLNETVFRGVGSVPNSVLMNFELDAPDDVVPPFEYDVEKAKEELAQSDYPDGFEVTMQYPSGLDYLKSMALFIQQNLGEIGIDVKLEELEAATATEKWSAGEFELIFPFTGTSSDIPVPDEYAVLFADPAPTNGFGSGWTSPAILKLVKEFIGNTDDSTRAAQWQEIQESFIEELPLLNVLDFPLINGHRIDVCGTKGNGLGVDQLQDTWIAP